MDTTVDINKSGNLATAEEARKEINAIIEQYRTLLKGIDSSIDFHEKELAALRAQRDRLLKLIPKNQPITLRYASSPFSKQSKTSKVFFTIRGFLFLFLPTSISFLFYIYIIKVR